MSKIYDDEILSSDIAEHRLIATAFMLPVRSQSSLNNSLHDSFNEIFLNNYSLKDDKRFMHADDVEETHVRDDWELE